jgi:hypothetical protein
MKLRIQDNTIRLRLNRREVGEFETAGRVEAFLDFPGGRRLMYVLENGGGPGMDALFDGACIRVRVPEPAAREWIGTDQVGIRHRQALGDDAELEIVIEKDFQCLHKGADARDPEAFPNPLLPGDADHAPADVARRVEGANDD